MSTERILKACIENDDAVLAIISGIDGPSYRPLGAMMSVLDQNSWVGSLSSGCIERDIALHAQQAHREDTIKTLRYGQGSPFIDITLPCGGGLDILLVPRPNTQMLAQILTRQQQRKACTLAIDVTSGTMKLQKNGATELKDNQLFIRFEPELQFFIFGKGPEASSFASLIQANQFPNLLLSPDSETLERAKDLHVTGQHLKSADWPKELTIDYRTAITLFFHDHDWEPQILLGALKTDAFYIGAQGSRATSARRHQTLQQMGATQTELERLKGPIGLIPSTRDPRTLAVSVLAEILDEVQRI